MQKPPIVPPPELPAFLTKWGPVGVGIGLLVAKWKSVFVVLKLAKLAPLLQMGASVVVYSVFFGWQYSLGAVLLIFFHELGHYVAMSACGLKPGPITFIPFLGASVQMDRQPASAFIEALVALAGPLCGGAISIALLVYAIQTGYPLAGALANFGLMINVVNLVPFAMLDGGRVIKALDPRMLLLGIPAFGYLVYLFPNPLLVLFLVMGLLTTFETLQRAPAAAEFYAITPAQRIFVAVVYILCVVILMTAFNISQEVKVSPKELMAMGDGTLGTGPQVLQWYDSLTEEIYQDDSLQVTFDTTKTKVEGPAFTRF